MTNDDTRGSPCALRVKLKPQSRRRTMDKSIAWYDPTNGAVSTDKDSPLFTPLGQVLPLYTQRTRIELTDDERQRIRTAVLKEKNT